MFYPSNEHPTNTQRLGKFATPVVTQLWGRALLVYFVLLFVYTMKQQVPSNGMEHTMPAI